MAVIESTTLRGHAEEHSFRSPGVFVVENTTVEFQRSPERQTFKIPGPLTADFIFKVGQPSSSSWASGTRSAAPLGLSQRLCARQEVPDGRVDTERVLNVSLLASVPETRAWLSSSAS